MNCPLCGNLSVVFNAFVSAIVPYKNIPFRKLRRRVTVKVAPCPMCQYHPTAHIKLKEVTNHAATG